MVKVWWVWEVGLAGEGKEGRRRDAGSAGRLLRNPLRVRRRELSRGNEPWREPTWHFQVGCATWRAFAVLALMGAQAAAGPGFLTDDKLGALPSEGSTLEGVVSIPWAADDADSVVAVFVEGSAVGPSEPSPSIDQRDLTFVPHVLPITVGTTVRFRNSDPVLHNVFSPSQQVTPFDLGTYPEGEKRAVRFDNPGEVVVLCNVHPQMSAFILVLETPFSTLTDAGGAYRIEGLPPGQHRVLIWNQAAETFESPIVIEEGKVSREDFVFSRRRRGGWILQDATSPH